MKSLYRIFLLLALLPAGAFSAGAQTDSLAGEESFTGAEFDPSIAVGNGYEVTQDELGRYRVRSSVSAVMGDILQLLERFFFNLLVSFLIVQVFYYRKSRRRDYYFTFMIFSSAMFLLLFVMNNLGLQIGFTIGLFAIFGMIRYRTETVPVREMTYLFVIIAVSVINGIGADVPFGEIAAVNALIILLIWLLEARGVFSKNTSTKLVVYDRVDLIVPERRAELTADLEKRIGVKIRDLEIGRVDFLKDTAWIKIRYELEKGEVNTVDTLRKPEDFAG